MTAVRRDHALPYGRRFLAAARAALPRGSSLSEQSWSARHGGICVLLWVHVAALPVIGVMNGQTLVHSVLEAEVAAVFAVAAVLPRLGPLVRSASATLGLLVSAAILVHFFDGLIEVHFHFFVLVAVVTLYQAWTPFLIAVGFVLLHHTIVGPSTSGLSGPSSGLDTPFLWALVHGGYILAESVACLLYWRITEDALDGERAARGGLEKAIGDLAQAQDLSGMGSSDWDLAANTLTWSDQFYTLAGVDPKTFTPSPETVLLLVHPDDRARVDDLVSAALETRAGLDFEYRLVRPDGEIRAIHSLGEFVTAADGQRLHMLGTAQDVTERKRLQAEIEHLAFHDPLTGLANRRLFMDRLDHAMAVKERSGRGCAVLFIDLDNFKGINDTFGHNAGDELLCEVSVRLTNAARSADTIARPGGDEFALLCEDVDLDMAILVAERIKEQLHRPIELQGTDIALRGSIGIALAEDGQSTEDILRDADAAMYAAKSAGKDTLRVFPLLGEQSRGRAADG